MAATETAPRRRSSPRAPRGRPPFDPPKRPARAGDAARGVHVVDTAVLFAELERPPDVTQADLARRYRKSPGYVSVLCRFGHAVGRLPPEARNPLRAPQLTFKAVQAIVSRHADPAAVLRAAEALAAAPTRRRERAHRGAPGQWNAAPQRPDSLDPLPEPPGSLAHANAFTYTWDGALAARNPAAALAAYEEHVRLTTDEVIARLRRAAGDVGSTDLTVAAAGQVGPAASARPDAATAELSLRRLHERVDVTLRAHRERLREFLADRAERTGRRAAPGGRAGPGGTFPRVAVTADEIDTDLS